MNQWNPQSACEWKKLKQLMSEGRLRINPGRSTFQWAE